MAEETPKTPELTDTELGAATGGAGLVDVTIPPAPTPVPIPYPNTSCSAAPVSKTKHLGG